MLTPTLTREQVAKILQCSHAELGQLLRAKRCPLPVRVEGAARWFEDEVTAAAPGVTAALERVRHRRTSRGSS